MAFLHLACLLFTFSRHVSHAFTDPDFDRTTPQLIISRGFSYQLYDVVTDDGYILSMWRIVNDRISEDAMKRPVLLAHGLTATSRDWLIAGPGGDADSPLEPIGDNMGFELAKRGYDVWLLDNRGNTYSQNHTRYPTTISVNPYPEYWDFTFTDMARFDVPAAVRLVLQETGRETLAYVGHSRGTTIMFVALALEPWLNDVIRPFVALSPITSIQHASGLLRTLPAIMSVSTFIFVPLYFPVVQNGFIPLAVKTATCTLANGDVCRRIFQAIGGDDRRAFNASRMPVFASRLPAGTYSKEVRHFYQNALLVGRLAEFDHGPIGNLWRYGRIKPPVFHLEDITTRHVYLMVGPRDTLSSRDDNCDLMRRLKHSIREKVVVQDEAFGHIAMVLGRNTGKIVIKPVLDILNRYN